MALLSSASNQFVYLSELLVAAPCVEFSRFAANCGLLLAAEQQKAALQFLHQGRRGFYATFASDQNPDRAIVQAGDRMFVAEEVSQTP